MVQKLKEIVIFYTTHFYLVDYLLIVLVLLILLSSLLLCLFLRHKSIVGLLIIALSLVLCFLLYLYAYKLIDRQLRHRQITLVGKNFIQSSKLLVLDLKLSNHSRRNFHYCKIGAKIFQHGGENFVQRYKNKLIPLRQKSGELFDLRRDTSQILRISFENFHKDANSTLRLKSLCF